MAGRDCLATFGARSASHEPDSSRLYAENEANAQLCAAAPNMLQELKDILGWALTEKAALREQEIESIRAVIAKATGATP